MSNSKPISQCSFCCWKTDKYYMNTHIKKHFNKYKVKSLFDFSRCLMLVCFTDYELFMSSLIKNFIHQTSDEKILIPYSKFAYDDEDDKNSILSYIQSHPLNTAGMDFKVCFFNQNNRKFFEFLETANKQLRKDQMLIFQNFTGILNHELFTQTVIADFDYRETINSQYSVKILPGPPERGSLRVWLETFVKIGYGKYCPFQKQNPHVGWYKNNICNRRSIISSHFNPFAGIKRYKTTINDSVKTPCIYCGKLIAFKAIKEHERQNCKIGNLFYSLCLYFNKKHSLTYRTVYVLCQMDETDYRPKLYRRFFHASYDAPLDAVCLTVQADTISEIWNKARQLPLFAKNGDPIHFVYYVVFLKDFPSNLTLVIKDIPNNALHLHLEIAHTNPGNHIETIITQQSSLSVSANVYQSMNTFFSFTDLVDLAKWIESSTIRNIKYYEKYHIFSDQKPDSFEVSDLDTESEEERIESD